MGGVDLTLLELAIGTVLIAAVGLTVKLLDRAKESARARAQGEAKDKQNADQIAALQRIIEEANLPVIVHQVQEFSTWRETHNAESQEIRSNQARILTLLEEQAKDISDMKKAIERLRSD